MKRKYLLLSRKSIRWRAEELAVERTECRTNSSTSLVFKLQSPLVTAPHQLGQTHHTGALFKPFTSLNPKLLHDFLMMLTIRLEDQATETQERSFQSKANDGHCAYLNCSYAWTDTLKSPLTDIRSIRST